MMRLTRYFSTRRTPQTESMPGSAMVRDSAGGHAYAVDDWARLDRFVILGTEGGTYYASAREITRESAEAVMRCLAEDGARAVARIVEISEAGRAPRQDPAIFALAMAAGVGDDATRSAALAALPRVCRTGTHLFQFADAVEGFRGWGRGLRRAVARWYTEMDLDRLVLQVIKYRARGARGHRWSHRDLLRLAHPVTAADQVARRALFEHICRPEAEITSVPALAQLEAAQRLARMTDGHEAARLIAEHRLPREAVPTELLREPRVWRALMADMPMGAMIRSLARMTEIGFLAPGSEAARTVVTRLGDVERLRRARVHPLALLAAMRTYAQGHGMRGDLVWEPVTEVVDALDGAFYDAFQTVEPTGRRLMLALDVSASMDWGTVAGSPLTPREASAAMALMTAACEMRGPGLVYVTAFAERMVPVTISPRQRLDDVIARTAALPFGGTDCAAPIVYAQERRIQVDAFVIYTDSETWCGDIHPVQALAEYRRRMGIAARLVVVAMTSAGFSIADPEDPGTLDVVGFDTATPALIADFVTGAI